MTTARAGVLLLAAACLALEASAHRDDTDASLYTVVARNLAADGTWTALRYTENVHPQYREHLPFGLWPSAVVVRTLGERALPWLSAAWTLGAIALLMKLGRRLFTPTIGVLAGFVLTTTHQFIVAGALHRLDPPLLFFSLLSVLPLLTAPPSARSFALSAAASAIAVAIKGPFGLVLPAAATVARALTERRASWLVFGAATGLVALVPAGLFLATAGDDWWTGYVQAQLLASASGARSDGTGNPLFPWVAIGAHFWPWLVALPLALRPKHEPWRRALLWVLVAVVVLMLPGRKLSHHVLLVFPGLSLLVAVALPVERLSARAARLAMGLIAVAALAAVAFVPQGRAVSCSDFGAVLAQQPSGTRVLVVSSGSPWREVGVLAAELRLRPWLESSVDAAPADVLLAVVSEDRAPTSGWRTVGRARGWLLLQRE